MFIFRFVFRAGHRQRSRPSKDNLAALCEMYPDLDANAFTISPHIRGAHGESRAGDVVLYLNAIGTRSVGQLLVNFAVIGTEYSVIEDWTYLPGGLSPSFLHMYQVTDVAVQILSANVISSLTARVPTGRSRTCYVIIPTGI